MAGIEKKWYVLRAIGGKEKKAKEMLDNEIRVLGLTDLVSEAVVPVERVYQQRNGKKYVKERILYAGYVFVEAALVGEVPHILRNIPNIINFLGDNNPIPMRPSEVARMIGTADQAIDDTLDMVVKFTKNEVVKVVDGPFNGFSGEIEEINEEKKKLLVMVKIFGRKTPLELGYLQVEKE
jgi:transcriptional antiterminator NusG